MFGYGKNCFDCTESMSNYIVASTGAGMDLEMLHDFGKRKLAINCPAQKGYLIINLSPEQIKDMTQGKLEKISEEAANKKLINSQMVWDYMIKNKEEIKFEIMGKCNISPPWP